MNCLQCDTKACKIEARDCNGDKKFIIPIYFEKNEQKIYKIADSLVSNGKAGKLTRVEEIILYIKENGYQNVAIAYCYSMEKQAKQFIDLLEKDNIHSESYRCTINGIRENDIGISDKDSVNCNPIGQAEAINNSKSEFVIEMGLCLGHDVLFHQYLKKPFTVLVVKDRVLAHDPLRHFDSDTYDNASFINALDDNFNMKSCDWLNSELSKKDIPFIIDLRTEDEYKDGHIPTSKNIPLKKLPESKNRLPEDKNKVIVGVCNGSVQSAYAIVYLFSIGYKNVYNLSGGYSKWKNLNYNVHIAD